MYVLEKVISRGMMTSVTYSKFIHKYSKRRNIPPCPPPWIVHP